MKKNQKVAASSSTPTTPSIDLKALIQSHSQFIDHLVELIPARFYLSNDDADKPWYQGLSKADKASLKQQSRENLKLSRRNRLDPENKASSSTLNLLQQKIKKTAEAEADELPQKFTFGDMDEDGDGDGEENRVNSVGLEEGSGNADRNDSVTYEELRQKLQRKKEELRGNRGEGGRRRVDDKRGKNVGKKRKRENDGDESGKEGNVGLNEGDDGEEIIEYGKVKLGDEEEGKNKKKKKKMSKVKELERVKRLQEVKRENMSVAERESWKAATNRAMGVKVHDDARMIKESLKKEKRKKAKNAEKWKERMESQEQRKKERQQKRKDNIVGRINEKKKRKIAKREKKLMRPGFEGRKEGYITKD